MRSWISLGVLFACVVALGAWVYYKPATRDAETHALSALKPAQVKRVQMERFVSVAQAPSPAAQQPIVLERQDATWRMTSPLQARADAFQIGRVLSILDARSTVRYRADDLARFGLDRPLAKVTIDDQSFAYGALNTTTREQYVLTGESVYVVPLSHGAALPREPDALLARELFSPAENPVRFELPGFSIALDDGTWRLQPMPTEASADERVAWVDAWRRAIAVRVTRHDGKASRADVKVALKDGKTVEIEIVQREPELVLMRADEGLRYHFFAANAKRLLSPPGAAAKPESR
jgi:hypothetical protein